jgi:threonine/homoserine/homoserine lactone efflux protein
MLATASGAQFGVRRSVPLIAGIAVGLATLVGAAALGLGSVTRAVPQFELWLRLVGSAYLLWLAWTIGRQGAPAGTTNGSASPIGFLAGLLLLWANPKGWSMAIAAAGTYAQLTESPITTAALTGGVFGVSATVSLAIWCVGGLWLARTIRSETGWRALNVTLAIVLVASTISMWR